MQGFMGEIYIYIKCDAQMQGIPVVDVREELRSFEESIRNLGMPLRILVQSVEAAAGDSQYNKMAKLHVDYHPLLHDNDLVQYGVSTCRLPLPLVHTLIHGVCFAYPDSLPDRLRAIAMFFLWIFFFDDIFDDPHIVGDDPHIDITLAFLQTSLRSSLLLLMDDTSQSSSSAIAATNHNTCHDLNYVVHGAAPWCREFRHLGMPTAQQRRLLHTLDAYIAGVFQQCQYRCSGTYPAELHDYAALRATESATYCCIVLVEFSVGIDVLSGLPPPGTEGLRAALDALFVNAALEVAFYNDLRSAQKEFEAGDVFNAIPYVYVHMKRRKAKKEEEEEATKLVEAATKEVVRMVGEYRMEAKRLETEMEHLLLLLLSKNLDRPTLAEDTRRYVAGVADMVAGLGRWQELSFRYNN